MLSNSRQSRARSVSTLVLVVGLFSFAPERSRGGELDAAGDLLVELNAVDYSTGALIWENVADDSIGDFVRIDQGGFDLANENGLPIVEEINGVTAVTFNSTGVMDCLASPGSAPEGLTGPDPTRSIEAWVYNPSPIASEETIVAWGKRGGPDGSEMSFNYGTHGNFGAVTHWGGGGPDMGWIDNTFTAGAPQADQWNHLVYTYDGETTRVYANGCLVDEGNCEMNSENLGFGALNTHLDPRIVVASQIEGDGVSLNFPLRGLLSVSQLRIHDGVLTPEEILNNYDVGFDTHFVASDCICRNCPAEDGTRPGEVYERQLDFASSPVSPVTGLAATSPAGATITEGGLFSYDVPNGSDSFTVEIECTNSEGTEVFSWEVEVFSDAPEVDDDVVIAEDLLVLLCAEHPSAGSSTWLNGGSSGADFTKIGNPIVETIAGVRAITFNSASNNDAYQGTQNAPAGLVGPDATRTIEVWAYNPQIDGEETLLSWGRRGGPDGTNMAFNYGNHGNFGAVGHWGGGGPDIGWIDNTFTAGAPEAGLWHHLVYTYDGETTRVYSDGVLWNEEFLGAGALNTRADAPITISQQLTGGGAIEFGGLSGRLSIAKILIHDGVLSEAEVRETYLVQCSDYRCDSNVRACPEEGDLDYADTHCTGIDVALTGVVFGPSHAITASGEDDSGDPVFYTMTADNGVLAPIVRGPQLEPEWRLRLNGEGWVISVTVDDQTACDDAADDATCTFSGDPVEICDNEVDDDGDGLTDCADDDCPPCPVTGFVRGDPNSNGEIDLTDGILILNFLFLGGSAPACMDSGDADDDGSVALTDAVRIFAYLFLGGDAPAPPSPAGTAALAEDCGPDPTDEDALDCADRGAICQ